MKIEMIEKSDFNTERTRFSLVNENKHLLKKFQEESSTFRNSQSKASNLEVSPDSYSQHDMIWEGSLGFLRHLCCSTIEYRFQIKEIFGFTALVKGGNAKLIYSMMILAGVQLIICQNTEDL